MTAEEFAKAIQDGSITIDEARTVLDAAAANDDEAGEDITPSDDDKDKDATAATEGRRKKRLALERRSANAVLEWRAADDAPKLKGDNVLHGYAAVWGAKSHPLPGEDDTEFIETIKQGAFTASLDRGDEVFARIQHEGGLRTIGRRSSGTLRLGEDDKGLWYEVDLPNTSAGNDLRELVKRKDISGSSFAFRATQDEWSGDMANREVVKADLYDVAPVDQGAYEDATVAMRSRQKAMAAQTSTEIHRRRLRLHEHTLTI